MPVDAATGQPVTLGAVLAEGGEGRLCATDRPGLVAKLYHRPVPERAVKLAALLLHPARSVAGVAWPVSALRDEAGRTIGFLMPRIEDAQPLTVLANARLRLAQAPGFTWYHLHVAARRLADLVGRLHAAEITVGDLKPENLLVDAKARITLIDADSVQFTLAGKMHRCAVGAEGFVAPELVGQDLAAQQALLLARQHGIDQRRVELIGRQDSGGLEHGGHARGVVIGAGRVGGEVHHIGDARIEVAGNDDDAVGIARSALDGDDIDDLGRGRHPAARDRVGRGDDLEAAAAGRADAFELALGPAAGGADAARLGLGLGHRVASAEVDHGLDVGAHALGLDQNTEGPQFGMIDGGGRLGGGRGREAHGQGNTGGEAEGRDQTHGNLLNRGVTVTASPPGGQALRRWPEAGHRQRRSRRLPEGLPEHPRRARGRRSE